METSSINTVSVVATELRAGTISGRWKDNNVKYFTGSVEYTFGSSLSDITFTVPFRRETGNECCIEFHADIFHPFHYEFGTSVTSSVCNGMDVQMRVYGNRGSSSTTSILASLNLTGVFISRDSAGNYYRNVDPCLITDIFVGPCYIKYSSLSYNTDYGISTKPNITTSYIYFFLQVTPELTLPISSLS